MKNDTITKSQPDKVVVLAFVLILVTVFTCSIYQAIRIIPAVIALALIWEGLIKISKSHMTDCMKFCWTVLVLIIPILGPISALMIIED